MTKHFDGWRVVEDPLMPVNQILATERQCTLTMHPLTALRTLYPLSPAWCQRTLGHRELQRDQRKQTKLNKGTVIYEPH